MGTFRNVVNNPNVNKKPTQVKKEEKQDNKVAFTQGGKQIDKNKIECYYCHKKGHFSSECPSKPQAEKSNAQTENKNNDNNTNQGGSSDAQPKVQNGVCQAQYGFHMRHVTHCLPTNTEVIEEDITHIPHSFVQNTSDIKEWLLLDNQSTTDIFCSARVLTNIRKVNEILKFTLNGGVLYASEKGYLNGYGDVWYHPDAITNILCLKHVKQKYRMVYAKHNMDFI